MQAYEKRIKGILETLKRQCNTDVFQIEKLKVLEIGYDQRNRIFEEADTWKNFCKGEVWGGKDKHFCFKTKIELPEDFQGKKVMVQVRTGATDIWNTDNPQFIAYIDGEMVCGMDMNHYEVCLSECAESGKTYDFWLYAYSNSLEPNIFLDLQVLIRRTDVEKIYYNIKVPFDVATFLKNDDLEKIKILEILNQCINLLDLRSMLSEEFYKSVQDADFFLEQEFYGKLCGSNDVSVYSIGHTHIDVAWKWTVRQTREKVMRSFSTVLYLMERYPEYKFMSSQPQLYQFAKEECPELFEKIKLRVLEGRWETEGAMWIEADCNLTSGESLIRQIIHGKRFFKEEFGKEDNVILWLPDVFGYSAALPQILKKTGIKYFMTTKIGWNEYNKIPNDTMLWQGIDGSEILTYFITTRNYEKYPELNISPNISTTYNGRQNASQIMGTWQRFQNKKLSSDVLTCYGHGDGGGGVTEQMLEESRRLERGIPGAPTVRQAFATEFFEKLEKNLEGKEIPKWCGELYLEFHRGTYTSMARNKKYNRLCEFKNSDAEFFSILNRIHGNECVYPVKELERAWKLVLLNQFHDILPGSSIKEVYEDSDKDYEEVLSIDNGLIKKAQFDITKKVLGRNSRNKAILVWNTLSFERECIIKLPVDFVGAKGDKGVLETQTTLDGVICRVPNVPAKGYLVLEGIECTEDFSNVGIKNNIGCKQLQTPYYDVTFNEYGEIIGLYDIKEDRQLIKSGCAANRLLVFEDRPLEYDAWNIDSYFEEKQWAIQEVVEWNIQEEGPIAIEIYIKKKFINSTVEQKIIFYKNSKRIDFETEVDWKQEQLLLKAEFPLDIMTTKAVYEIQYGNVERSTHRNTSWDQAKFEVCGHKWIDLAEEGYGVALLNDCKYGYDLKESNMRITLIKSGIFPNPTADQEVHNFTYALYPHEGDFRTGNVIQEAYKLNCPCYVTSGEGESPCTSYSMFTIEENHVLADVVKKSEDNDDIIIRVYEAYGKRGKVHCNLNNMQAVEVWECDMLEQKEVLYELANEVMCFEIKPYEIKTFRIMQK